MEQNRDQNKIKTHIYIHIANWHFTKAQRQYSGEKKAFSTNVAGTSRYEYQKKNELKQELGSTHCTIYITQDG